MKRIFSILFALVLALSLVMLSAGVVQAANLYEHYNTGDDHSTSGPAGDYWYAQTFTAESDHSVTSVKLKLWRTGSPGTITVFIRATDGFGHPTGSDLTSGTIDGDTLSTNSTGEWRGIALTSYDLIYGTQYAIIIKAPDAGVGNYPHILYDDSSPTYAGGNVEISSNEGGAWTAYAGKDFMFEVHGPPLAQNGVPLVEVGGEVSPVNKPALLAPWIALAAAIIAGATIAVRRRRTQS